MATRGASAPRHCAAPKRGRSTRPRARAGVVGARDSRRRSSARSRPCAPTRARRRRRRGTRWAAAAPSRCGGGARAPPRRRGTDRARARPLHRAPRRCGSSGRRRVEQGAHDDRVAAPRGHVERGHALRRDHVLDDDTAHAEPAARTASMRQHAPLAAPAALSALTHSRYSRARRVRLAAARARGAQCVRAQLVPPQLAAHEPNPSGSASSLPAANGGVQRESATSDDVRVIALVARGRDFRPEVERAVERHGADIDSRRIL